MHFNEIDILNLIIIARVLYSGFNAGIFNELIKGLGIFFATILAAHYGSSLGHFLGEKLIIPAKQQDISGFLLVAGFIILLSFLIREGWMIILKIETHSRLINWGGLIFSLGRAYLLCGLTVLSLMISGNEFMMQRTYTSISRVFFKYASIDVYQEFYNNVIVRFFPNEPLNQGIIDSLSEQK